MLAEFAESFDAEVLQAEARRVPAAWVQRLGYLLVLVEQDDLAVCLVDGVLAERNAFTVALARQDMEGTTRDLRWQVAINIEVEPDV